MLKGYSTLIIAETIEIILLVEDPRTEAVEYQLNRKLEFGT